MAILAVFHHYKPPLQCLGMANGACRHLAGRRLKDLFHEHGTIREPSILAIGSDRARRRVNDMDLFRTLPLSSATAQLPNS